MKKQLTPEQIAARDAKRERFKVIVKKIAAMPEAERAQLIMQAGAVVTCEGRALSLTNTMLAVLQFPGVSIVGGFRQWLKAGRCVRKGEHGLSIWIPLGMKRDGSQELIGQLEEAAGDAGGSAKFGTATVFDVSQTCEFPADAAKQETTASEEPADAGAEVAA